MANVIEIIVQADIKRLTAGMASAGRAVAAFGKKAAEAGKAVAGLAAPLAKIGTVGAAGFTALAAASITSAEEIQKQLRGLDSGLDGVAGHMENLRRVALRNGQAISSILPGYLAFQRAVGGLGGATGGAVQTTGAVSAILDDVFNKLQAAGRLGGVGQENIATVFEALSDALREGETDADALVATLSQVPALRDIIRRLPIFDGKVTGEQALVAVARELDGIEKQADDIPLGLAETWENVKTRIGGAIADGLQKPLENVLPRVDDIAAKISSFISGLDFGKIIDGIGAAIESVSVGVARFVGNLIVGFSQLKSIFADIKKAALELNFTRVTFDPFASDEEKDAAYDALIKATEQQAVAQRAITDAKNAAAEIEKTTIDFFKSTAEKAKEQAQQTADQDPVTVPIQTEVDKKSLDKSFNEIKRSVNAEGIVVYYNQAAVDSLAALRGSISPGFADGGAVHGPGGPRQDNLLAWLSNGEYVIPAHAVRHYGEAFFDALRSMRLPRLADGGRADGGTPGGGGLAPVYLTIGGASMKRPLWADSETVRQLRRAEANA